MPLGGGQGESDLPVIDADAWTIGRPSVRRRTAAGRAGRARGVGLAVAALVLLTSGVAVGGILQPPPSGNPSTSPTDGSLHASPAVPDDCEPARGRVPIFTLAVAGRNDAGSAGVLTFSHRYDETTPVRGWIVPEPGADTLTTSPGHDLELRVDRGVCFRFVKAEYADASPGGTPAAGARVTLVDGAVSPPAFRPVIGSLPAGDWVVQVTAYFFTGVDGARGHLVAQRSFRVNVGSGPFETLVPTPSPRPTPAVVPDSPCGPEATTPEEVGVVVVTPGADPVAGVPPGTEVPVVTVAIGDPINLVILEDRCATSWSIRLLDEVTGDYRDGETRRNEHEDAGWAAQNHWQLRPNVGTYRLLVELHMGRDVALSREWLINVTPFDVPATWLIADDGRRVQALPGCGLYVELRNGWTTSDSCGSLGFPDGLEVLRVPAWSVVRLEIEGWTIQSWGGACGSLGTDEGQNQTFVSDSCGLGGYYTEAGQEPPAVAQFLARPGEQVLQIGLQGNRDGDIFSVSFYALVTGE